LSPFKKQETAPNDAVQADI